MKQIHAMKKWGYRFLDAIGAGLTFSWMKRPSSWNGSPRRILLVEFYGIGDLVILSGVLDPLKRAWPEAEISLLGSPFAADLFAHDARVKEVITFDFPWRDKRQKKAFFHWPWRRLRQLMKTLQAGHFDLAMGRTDLPMNVLLGFSGARHTVGFNLPGGRFLLSQRIRQVQSVHDYEGRMWEAYLAALGVKEVRCRPRLVPDPAFAAAAEKILEQVAPRARSLPLVGIHAGASSPLKRWPLDRFQALAAEIAKQAVVLWFLDENNLPSGLELPGQVIEIRTNLKTFVQLLARCRVIICNDSSPMHLGAALNVPVITIFGPQLWERFAPPGLCTAVSVPGWACRPCNYHCKYGEPLCIQAVRTGQVLEAVQAQLTKSIRGDRFDPPPADCG